MFCCFGVQCSIDVCQVQLVYSVIPAFYFLLIFSLVALYMIDNGLLKFPTIIVKLSNFLFISVNFCFMYFGVMSLVHIIIVIPSQWIDPFITIKCPSFYPVIIFTFSIFCLIFMQTLFLVVCCMMFLFLSFHFQCICIFKVCH